MKRFASLLAISLLCIFPQSTVAQCQVTAHNSEDGTWMIEHEAEQLQQPTDFIDGFRVADAQLVLAGDDSEEISVLILFLGVTSHQKPTLVPRKVRIMFSNRSPLARTAESCEVKNINNQFYTQRCSYILSEDDIHNMIQNEISNMKIIDHKAGYEMDATPVYGRLLQDQLSCIANEASYSP